MNIGAGATLPVGIPVPAARILIREDVCTIIGGVPRPVRMPVGVVDRRSIRPRPGSIYKAA